MRRKFAVALALIGAALFALAGTASATVKALDAANPSFNGAKMTEYYTDKERTLEDIITKSDKTYKLLFYYSPSCGNCRLLMGNLNNNTAFAGASDIEVIIASTMGYVDDTNANPYVTGTNWGYKKGFITIPGTSANKAAWLHEDIEAIAPSILKWNNTSLYVNTSQGGLGGHVGEWPGKAGGTPTVYLFKGSSLRGATNYTEAVNAGQYITFINGLRPDKAGNKITCATSGTAGIPITFTAEGAAQGGDNPAEGDEKYVPYMWTVADHEGTIVNSGDLTPKDGKFTANAYANAPGMFTLTVKYRLYAFLGGEWKMTSAAPADTQTAGFELTSDNMSIKEHYITDNPYSAAKVVNERTGDSSKTFADWLTAPGRKKYQLVVLYKVGCSTCRNIISAINTNPDLFKDKSDIDVIFEGCAGTEDDDYMNGDIKGTGEHQANAADLLTWNNTQFYRETSHGPYAGAVISHAASKCGYGNQFATPIVLIYKDGILRGSRSGSIHGSNQYWRAAKFAAFIDYLRAEDFTVDETGKIPGGDDGDTPGTDGGDKPCDNCGDPSCDGDCDTGGDEDGSGGTDGGDTGGDEGGSGGTDGGDTGGNEGGSGGTDGGDTGGTDGGETGGDEGGTGGTDGGDTGGDEGGTGGTDGGDTGGEGGSGGTDGGEADNGGDNTAAGNDAPHRIISIIDELNNADDQTAYQSLKEQIAADGANVFMMNLGRSQILSVANEYNPGWCLVGEEDTIVLDLVFMRKSASERGFEYNPMSPKHRSTLQVIITRDRDGRRFPSEPITVDGGHATLKISMANLMTLSKAILSDGEVCADDADLFAAEAKRTESFTLSVPELDISTKFGVIHDYSVDDPNNNLLGTAGGGGGCALASGIVIAGAAAVIRLRGRRR